MTTSLEEVKTYLRVDGSDEDILITSFILTSEELCEGILRYPLSDLETVPETVKQAVFYAVGQFYEQREQVDTKSVIQVITSLLFSYRKESW